MLIRFVAVWIGILTALPFVLGVWPVSWIWTGARGGAAQPVTSCVNDMAVLFALFLVFAIGGSAAHMLWSRRRHGRRAGLWIVGVGTLLLVVADWGCLVAGLISAASFGILLSPGAVRACNVGAAVDQ